MPLLFNGPRERFGPFLKDCIIETISKKGALCPEEGRLLNEIGFIRNAREGHLRFHNKRARTQFKQEEGYYRHVFDTHNTQ